MFRAMVLSLIVLGPVLPASAQDALSFQFRVGDTFFTEERLHQKQTVTVMEQVQEVETNQTTISRFRVLKVDPEGNIDLEFRLEAIREEAEDRDANGILERMEGATFQLTLDSEGAISRFTGYKQFLERVSEGDPNLAEAFGNILSEDSLKTLVQQTFSVVSNHSVREGETWKQDFSVTLGPFGNMRVERTFQHEGYGPRADGGRTVRMSMTGSAEYEAPRNNVPGFPFRITKGELKFRDIEGSGLFNVDTGRLNHLIGSLKLDGTLTVKIGDQETDVKIQQTQSTSFRFLDKNPLADDDAGN